MTINTFLTQLAEHCGVSAELITVDQKEDGDYLKISLGLPEEDSGRFIGFHGDTLESLQRILRIIFQEKTEADAAEKGKRILLNINNYRQDRAERLEEITHSVAQKVLETNSPFTFQSFLPAHERFIIHTTLSELPEADQLESLSEGEGRLRRLTIRKKN